MTDLAQFHRDGWHAASGPHVVPVLDGATLEQFLPGVSDDIEDWEAEIQRQSAPDTAGAKGIEDAVNNLNAVNSSRSFLEASKSGGRAMAKAVAEDKATEAFASRVADALYDLLFGKPNEDQVPK